MERDSVDFYEAMFNVDLACGALEDISSHLSLVLGNDLLPASLRPKIEEIKDIASISKVVKENIEEMV